MPSLADTKLDLANANVLIVQSKPSEQDILAQMLMGFGVPGIHRCQTAEEALLSLSREVFDLAIVDARLAESDGYTLVSKLRRHQREDLRHLPIILVCGHIRRNDVYKARDCGSNFAISKPISSRVLFDRIVWMARDQRQFVVCDSYAGPDRRFKAFGPPVGMKGRRSGDLSEHVGEAKEPNMSQDVIDGFFGAKKVSV